MKYLRRSTLFEVFGDRGGSLWKAIESGDLMGACEILKGGAECLVDVDGNEIRYIDVGVDERPTLVWREEFGVESVSITDEGLGAVIRNLTFSPSGYL